MKCDYCKLNRKTHCGYSGGIFPEDGCGHGVCDTDKLIRMLADNDARIAVLMKALKVVRYSIELDNYPRGEIKQKWIDYIEQAINGKENSK